MPFEAAGGLRWRYSPSFDILFEGRLPVDHASYLILSGEWYIPYLTLPGGARQAGIFLRSGMNFKNYDDHGFMGSFSGGFGLKAGGLSFDYAFSPYGELGAAHRLTAGWSWGGEKVASRPVSRQSLKEKEGMPVKGQPAREGLVMAPFSSGGAATETEAAVLRNLVEGELVKTGYYRMVERSNMDFILKEKKLAASGLTSEDLAADLGRFFRAENAVFGLVYKDKTGYIITVRLVDSATGEILRSESAKAREDYFFTDAARTIAAALSK